MTTTLGPALGHGLVLSQTGTGASPGYDAIDIRRMVAGFARGEGVSTYGSFRVSQRAAGANMSIDVNMDDGAHVRGDAVTLQSLYYVPPHASTVNETIATADATNPRIDRVVLELKDTTHDASGSALAQTRVITGTPTGGATLDNLTGAGAVPSSALLLADVLVAATDTAISNAEIRDRRAFSSLGTVPSLLTAVDMVSPTSPVLLQLPDTTSDIVGSQQVAAAIFLPRRIVSATRIRWRYLHSANAATGNYVLGIFDASGRKIVDTGAVAFTGAANSYQTRSETISATTFEPGWYYAFIGLGALGVGTSAGMVGWRQSQTLGATVTPEIQIPNVYLYSATGGTTVPNTLLSFTDAVTLTTGTAVGKVPAFGLSVG